MPDPTPRRPVAVKVVVTGPFKSGKTALIRSLSDINVLTTERSVSTPGPGGAATVPLDFGRIGIDEGLSVQLFGTPSHTQFDFLWEIVTDGLLGFIVLVDDSRSETVDQGMAMLTYFRRRTDVPFVVGVNHVAGDPERAVQRARHVLRIPDHVRVVEVDATDATSARALLVELFHAAQDSISSSAEPRAV